MDQYILANFDLKLNDKYFKFCFMPQVTNYEDIFVALTTFKEEVEKMQVAQVEAEAKAKAEKEAAGEKSEGEAVVEPEAAA